MNVSRHLETALPQTGQWTQMPSRGPQWVLAIAVSLLLISGCKQGNSSNISPKTVAKSYLQAMVAGDAAGIRKWSTGDEASAAWLAAQGEVMAAQERYFAAAKARFEDPMPAMVGRRASDHPAVRLTTIDAEKEAMDEQSGYIGEGRNKLFLVKTLGGWLVDRSRLVPPDLKDASSSVADAAAMKAAYDHAAAELASGHLATPAEARAAVMGGVEQRLKKLYPPTTLPASKPTSLPASRPAIPAPTGR